MKLVRVYKQSVFILFSLIVFQSAQSQIWTMQQCIDTAQVRNKSLQIYRNNISISEQREKEAKANLLPKVTANADYRYYFNLPYQLMPLSAFGGPLGEYKAIQFGVPNVINANVQLSMAVYNPQTYGTLQTNKIASELTELQYQKTEEQIYYEISNLYYNAQILHHQISFIDSNIINAEKLLKNIQLLNEQLMAKVSDVSKVKLQVSQLTTQKFFVSNKYKQVINALKFSMGIPIENNLQIEANIQYESTIENDPVSTIDIRIIKTKNRLLLSELSTLKRSMFLPSLNLIGTYGTNGFGYKGQPNSFLDFYPISFVGIQFSFPLFNGTITQQKIYQKKVELKNNELQFELDTEQNIMQVENAISQRTAVRKSVETTTVEIDLAKTIYDQTLLQQKNGIANLTDVLLAEQAVREAQQTYLAAIIEFLKADLELKKLAGNISKSQ